LADLEGALDLLRSGKRNPLQESAEIGGYRHEFSEAWAMSRIRAPHQASSL